MRKNKRISVKPRTRRRRAIALAVILALAATGGAIAYRSLVSPSEEQVSTQGLTPSTPAKEYYYAGGKLVATEQTESSGGCSYSINPVSQSVASGGGSFNVSVTASAGCAWTATSNDAWITITAGASGIGNGTVSYSVQSNSGSSQRTGTITIAGLTHSVVQAGTGGGSCSYSINPTSQTFTSSGGASSVTVTTQTGCAWTAVSNASWVTITSGSSGTGSGTVNYSVASNSSTSQRTGTMTIAGQTMTVTQSGASGGGTACQFVSLSPATRTVSAPGGSFSFTVSSVTPAGCNWTASSNVSWVTITSGSSGTGNGTVTYSVAQNNTGITRSGKITMNSGQIHTVKQNP